MSVGSCRRLHVSTEASGRSPVCASGAPARPRGRTQFPGSVSGARSQRFPTILLSMVNGNARGARGATPMRRRRIAACCRSRRSCCRRSVRERALRRFDGVVIGPRYVLSSRHQWADPSTHARRTPERQRQTPVRSGLIGRGQPIPRRHRVTRMVATVRSTHAARRSQRRVTAASAVVALLSVSACQDEPPHGRGAGRSHQVCSPDADPAIAHRWRPERRPGMHRLPADNVRVGGK
jgi:hypothetical protein